MSNVAQIQVLVLGREEDSSVLRRLAADMGSVDFFTDSGRALEILARHRYDAAFIDCDDVAGGLLVLKRLLTIPYNMSCTAIAISNGATSVQSAFRMGARFFLEKPISVDRARPYLRAAYGIMISQRGRIFRHAVAIPTSILRPDNFAGHATILNISEGGFAFDLPRPIKAGTTIHLRFSLPEVAVNIECSAEVVWADLRGRAGGRFLQVPSGMRHALRLWLSDKWRRVALPQFGPYSAVKAGPPGVTAGVLSD